MLLCTDGSLTEHKHIEHFRSLEFSEIYCQLKFIETILSFLEQPSQP